MADGPERREEKREWGQTNLKDRSLFTELIKEALATN